VGAIVGLTFANGLDGGSNPVRNTGRIGRIGKQYSAIGSGVACRPSIAT
jgi:hypothetical protein